MRSIFGRNKPMIAMDPNTVAQVNQLSEAVRKLNAQMATLADHAQKYAAAMGQTPAGGANRPNNFPTLWRPGVAQPRVPGFTPPMITPPAAPAQGGGGAGRGGAGMGAGRNLSFGQEVFLGGYIRDIMRFASQQMSQLSQRERVTTRLAMAQAGPYQGTGQAQPWQGMLRGATGYSSSGDLYAGAQTLSQLGLMTSAKDPRTRQVVRQTGQLAVMGGTSYQGAAQAVAGFMAPQTVNALMGGALGKSINATPGGQIDLLGQQGLMEKMYGALNRGRTGKQSEDFFRQGVRPGSPLYAQMQAAGFGEEQMGMVQQYGIARGEGKSADEVQKDISKRYKDVGENLRRFQEAVSDLKDSFSDGLLPAITGVIDAVNPVLRLFAKIISPLTSAQKGIALLATVVAAAAAKIAISNALGGGGLSGILRGVGQGGMIAGGEALGGAGLLGTAGTIGAGLIGGTIGSRLGRKVGGTGAKGKAASAGGGLLAGALSGAAAGGVAGGIAGGGIFSVPAAGAGAIIGGVGGLAMGLLGDGSSSGAGLPGYSDKELIAHPPPPTDTPGGGPLPGAGNSANLNPDFLSRLQAMFAANPKLSLTSGWRSHAEQAYLRWQLLTGKRTKAVAEVGKSRHETGRAADLGPPSQYDWLRKHATEFGVANVGAQFGEAWHYEPVGSVTPTPTPAQPAPGGTASAPSAPSSSASTATPAAVTASSATSTMTKPTVVRPTRYGGSGLGMNEVDILGSFGGGGTDMGDPVPGAMPMMSGAPGSSGGMGGGSLTIGQVTIHLSYERATPEEAERSARTIAGLLSDRERLLAIARN